MLSKPGAGSKAHSSGMGNPVLHPTEKMVFLHWFETQVRKTPYNTAVIFNDRSLSYRELNEKANQLAHYLADKHNQSPLIGVCVPRSIDMLIGLLAIQKTGAGYVALDPIHPPDRLHMIASEAKLDQIITHSSCQHLIQHVPGNPIVLDEATTQIELQAKSNPNININETNCVYVNFTSGTTGRPKGILIQQNSLTYLLRSMQQILAIEPKHKWLAVSTLAFDISALELFLPLMTGASVYIADDIQVNDGITLQRILDKHSISHLQTTPTNWQLLLNSGFKGSPCLTALCGGEPLGEHLVKQLLTVSKETYNLYGPTETTIWSSYKKLTLDNSQVTIGKPIDNEKFYVLNDELDQLNMGTEGQLYIGGVGLARGYLNQEDLTQHAFIPSPFTLGDRLYKTGDTVRQLENGEYQYIGRSDNQVKIRGFRVECSEIEALLYQQNNISQAVVLANNGKPKQLYAFIVNPFETIDPMKLRNSLRQHLPEQMIPSYFIQLEKLPLTPNGKIDRKALIPPETINIHRSQYLLPETPIEIAIAAIWQQLLHIDSVSRNDHFLDLGGNSLLAVHAIDLIKQKTGYSFNLNSLFFNSLQQLCNTISNEPTTTFNINRHHQLEPFYFSSYNNELYGCLYKPSQINNNSAIVICNPIGHEYLSCHRSMKILAETLCDRGYTVFRFDYSGCGDSEGDFDEVSLSRNLKDIHNAIQYLQSTHSFQTISLVGVRMGASLAMAYCNQFDNVERLVLWSPIGSGQDYIADLKQTHQDYNPKVRSSLHEYMGHRYSDELIAEITSLHFSLPKNFTTPTLLLTEKPILNSITGEAINNIEQYIHAESSIWQFDPSKVVIPKILIEKIGNWFGVLNSEYSI